MTVFRCMKCLGKSHDVRLVEHGTDDMPLCKPCFKIIKHEFDMKMDD